MTIHSYKYYNIYCAITKHYKDLDLKKSKDIYTESHHIIPRSMGGNDSADNLVCVPSRVHFLLHWMLYRIYRTQSMAFAWHRMCTTVNGKRYTSKSYMYAKNALSVAQKGRVMTEEQRLKISAAKTGKPLSVEHRSSISSGLIGRIQTQEAKEKIGAKHKGKVVSDSSKLKMSIAKKGKPAHNKGTILTTEQKDHLSRLNKGNVHSAESKLKMSITRKGKTKSDEHRAAISAALKERHRIKLLQRLPTDP
jgi:hypothetical protein